MLLFVLPAQDEAESSLINNISIAIITCKNIVFFIIVTNSTVKFLVGIFRHRMTLSQVTP